MTVQPDDLYELLRKIRYDATAIQGKITDAFTILADLNLQEQPAAVCPKCQLELRGQRTLAEHLYVSHNGPVPPHYAAIETASLEPWEPSKDQSVYDPIGGQR